MPWMKSLIYDMRTRHGRGKYAYLTEEGRVKAREILATLDIEDKDIYQRFEFRSIRQEEADEAADIERICFPPNEACSRQHMKERIAVAADTFLVCKKYTRCMPNSRQLLKTTKTNCSGHTGRSWRRHTGNNRATISI